MKIKELKLDYNLILDNVTESILDGMDMNGMYDFIAESMDGGCMPMRQCCGTIEELFDYSYMAISSDWIISPEKDYNPKYDPTNENNTHIEEVDREYFKSIGVNPEDIKIEWVDNTKQ